MGVKTHSPFSHLSVVQASPSLHTGKQTEECLAFTHKDKVAGEGKGPILTCEEEKVSFYNGQRAKRIGNIVATPPTTFVLLERSEPFKCEEEDGVGKLPDFKTPSTLSTHHLPFPLLACCLAT